MFLFLLPFLGEHKMCDMIYVIFAYWGTWGFSLDITTDGVSSLYLSGSIELLGVLVTFTDIPWLESLVFGEDIPVCNLLVVIWFVSCLPVSEASSWLCLSGFSSSEIGKWAPSSVRLLLRGLVITLSSSIDGILVKNCNLVERLGIDAALLSFLIGPASFWSCQTLFFSKGSMMPLKYEKEASKCSGAEVFRVETDEEWPRTSSPALESFRLFDNSSTIFR